MKITKSAVALVALLSLNACVTSGHDESASDTALAGSEWIVDDIAGQGLIEDTQATLSFGNDGRVSGDTSCNRYFAEYTVSETELRFQNAGVTKRACAPAVMEQESRFLAIFNAVDSYRIDDRAHTLVLSTPTGATITARHPNR
ncbi:META domain-containing protein [Sphingomicrobium sp. XHP0235]|uniref:META domain-containing protein n=1 Tax=Sphingomicrobium aquimarinum TaxID=3133971 RepID=UPI0031FE4F83